MITVEITDTPNGFEMESDTLLTKYDGKNYWIEDKETHQTIKTEQDYKAVVGFVEAEENRRKQSCV